MAVRVATQMHDAPSDLVLLLGCRNALRLGVVRLARPSQQHLVVPPRHVAMHPLVAEVVREEADRLIVDRAWLA